MSTAAGHDGGVGTEAGTVSMVQPATPAQPPGRADSGGDEDEAAAQAVEWLSDARASENISTENRQLLKSEVGAKTYKEITDKNLCNKFVLVRAEL